MPVPIAGTFHLPVLDLTYTAGPPDHTVPALKEMLAGNYKAGFALDIETFGLDADARRLKSIAIATPDRAVMLDPRLDTDRNILRYFLTHAVADGAALIFHNSTFDVPNLAVNDLFDQEWAKNVIDTVIYARLAEPGDTIPKTLEACAQRYLGLSLETSMQQVFRRLGMSKVEGYRTTDINTPMFVMGNCGDAVVTARLVEPIIDAAYRRLTEDHPFTDNGVTGYEAEALTHREQRINRMLLRRAIKGYRVDYEFLDRYRDDTAGLLATLESELSEAGIRPGNAGDLIRFLEDRNLIPDGYPRTAKTQRPSTRKDDLPMIGHPIAKAFVQAKEITKLDNDYLSKVVDLSVNGRIHPVTNLLKAAHGRTSMGSPPLQQFPGPARGIVMADDGDEMTSIDWSQIEPVVAFNIAGDVKLLEGYEAGTMDVYEGVGGAANIPRKPAKVVLLAQMYGEGLKKLAGDLGITVGAAGDLAQLVRTSMPETSKMFRKIRNIAERFKLMFTLSGRIVHIPSGMYDGEWSVQTHKAINYFVCGSAYDILAEDLIKIEEAGLGDALYLTMHDETVVSTSAAHDIRKIMSTPPERLCRLAKRTPTLRTDMANLGIRWAEA